MATAPNVIDFAPIRQLDEIVREEARRIRCEDLLARQPDFTLFARGIQAGKYDTDHDIVALRTAIRRGIEIGREQVRQGR